MHTQPLISIIVPIYKVPEAQLRCCVNSLILQTLTNIEIILIDDGSPDDCGKICDEYAANDGRIKVLHKVNGGLAAARNSGFDASLGKTIMFVDGDDWIERDTCELVYNAYRKSNAELVMFDQIRDFGRKSFIVKSFDSESKLIEGDDCLLLRKKMFDFSGNISMAFQKLIDSDFLRKHQIRHVDSLKQGMEGFVFNIQLFRYLTSAYYLQKPLYHYIYNSQSITHTPSEKNYFLINECLEWMDRYIQENSMGDNVRDCFLNRTLYVLCNTAISCYFNPSLHCSYKERGEKMHKYTQLRIMNQALKSAPRKSLGIQRIWILFFLQNRMYFPLFVLGKIRKYQLEHN